MKTLIYTCAFLLSISLISGCIRGDNTGSNTGKPLEDRLPEAESAAADTESNLSIPETGALREQLTIGFRLLENGERVERPEALLNEVMENLQRYLEIAESMSLSDQDFQSISPGIDVKEISTARIFTYRGKPELFGDSAAACYSYLQIAGERPAVFPLYKADSRQITHVMEIDRNLVALAGHDIGARPRIAFVDIAEIKDDALTLSGGLAPYRDDKWQISSQSNLIERTDGLLIETFISSAEKRMIEVGSSESESLPLVWNDTISKFAVSVDEE